MKKLSHILTFLIFATTFSHAQTIFNGYAYLSDGTSPGVGPVWFDLNGSAQSFDLDGFDLDTQLTIEDDLWLGGQTGFWSDGQGVEYIRMHYAIGGDATAGGTIDYSFQSFSSPNDQWGTDVNGSNLSEGSLNIISTHSLNPGSYTLRVWVEGKANNRSAIFDNNGGSDYNATFTVIPEPSSIIMMGLTGLAAAGLTLLKRRRKA